MTVAAFLLEILKECGTELGVLFGLLAVLWGEFPETRPFWLNWILNNKRGVLALLAGLSFYGAIYNSAGRTPDTFSLVLIALSTVLAFGAVLARRPA